MKQAPDTITIIGLGRVGKALLKAFTDNGYEVKSVFNRSEISPEITRKFPETTFKTELTSDLKFYGDLVFITVSDDAIHDMSNQIALNFSSFDGRGIIHCSGTHSSVILSSLEQLGAKVASFHPLQAITQSTDSFEGTWFDLEGDEVVLSKLEGIAKKLQANTFRVAPEAKPFLHASAVVASNYMVVLADLVTKISEKGNIPKETAIQALAPLMENTLQNIKELGVTDALTGPIARGDVETVKRHLESLKNAPDIISLYKVLGAEAVKIAERKNQSSKSLDTIKNYLREYSI